MKIILPFVLLALVLVVWFLWIPFSEPLEEDLVQGSAALAADPPELGEKPERGGDALLRVCAADVDPQAVDSGSLVSAETEEDVGALELQVRWKADGGPVSGAAVEMFVGAGHTSVSRKQVRTTDDAGRIRYESVLAGPVTLHCLLGGWVDAEVREGALQKVVLHVEAGILLRGVVVDERRVPVGGARIWFSSEGYEMVGGFVAETLEDGTFDVRTGALTALVGAEKAGYVPSARILLDRAEEAAVDLVLELTRGGGRVAGRVVDQSGNAVPRAQLALATGVRRIRRTIDGQVKGPATRFRMNASEEGAFEYDGLPSTPWVLWAVAPGYSPRVLVLEDETEAQDLVLVELGVPGQISGTVLAPGGEPLEQVSVQLTYPGQRPMGFESPFRYYATTDARGRYELTDLPVGEVSVTLRSRQQWVKRTTLVVRAGETTSFDHRFRVKGVVAGLVTNATGKPLPEYQVVARTPVAVRGYHGGRSTTDASGRFEVTGLEDWEHVIEVRGPGSGYSSWVSMARPGDPELLIRIDPAQEPTASLTATIVDSRSRPVPGAEVALVFVRDGELESGGRIFTCDQEGRFVAPHLPGGEYALRLEAPGEARVTHRVQVPPGQAHDAGTLAFPATGSARFFLRGTPKGTVQFSVWQGGEWVCTCERDGDLVRTGPLAAGAYEVHSSGEFVLLRKTPFRIRVGRRTERELELREGRMQWVRFSVSASATHEALRNPVRYEVRGAGGQVVDQGRFEPAASTLRRDLEAERKTGQRIVAYRGFSLPYGDYVLHVTRNAGTLERSFTLTPTIELETLEVVLESP